MTALLLAALIAFAPAPFPKRAAPASHLAGEYHYDPGGSTLRPSWGTSYRISFGADGTYNAVRYPDYEHTSGTWVGGGSGFDLAELRAEGRDRTSPYHWFISRRHPGLVKLGR